MVLDNIISHEELKAISNEIKGLEKEGAFESHTFQAATGTRTDKVTWLTGDINDKLHGHHDHETNTVSEGTRDPSSIIDGDDTSPTSSSSIRALSKIIHLLRGIIHEVLFFSVLSIS